MESACQRIALLWTDNSTRKSSLTLHSTFVLVLKSTIEYAVEFWWMVERWDRFKLSTRDKCVIWVSPVVLRVHLVDHCDFMDIMTAMCTPHPCACPPIHPSGEDMSVSPFITKSRFAIQRGLTLKLLPRQSNLLRVREPAAVSRLLERAPKFAPHSELFG